MNLENTMNIEQQRELAGECGARVMDTGVVFFSLDAIARITNI